MKTAARPNSPSWADFRQAYLTEGPYVFRVLRRLGGPTSELEDLVHDVFTAAFRSWATLDTTRPLRPWLYGIAVRIMLDKHRKHSTHSEVSHADVPDRVDHRPDPLRIAEARQGLTAAQQIIDGLEIDRRTVFVLHDLEGLTMPEIAQQVGVPLATAYSRLRLARRDFDAAARPLTLEENLHG
jgi:RNA polymerase sigma-70 factor (ECF subfamily)